MVRHRHAIRSRDRDPPMVDISEMLDITKSSDNPDRTDIRSTPVWTTGTE